MLLRLFHHDATACASYLFGCTTHETLAVVDPHVDLVDSYIEAAEAAGRRSWRCLRPMFRPTTSPGCRPWSRAPARQPICPPEPGSSSRTGR